MAFNRYSGGVDNRYIKYLVTITLNRHVSYEQLYYKQVFKRTYYVLAKDKVKAINTARFEILLRENITAYNFETHYLVKRVKPNHYKYITKRIAKRRCKQ